MQGRDIDINPRTVVFLDLSDVAIERSHMMEPHHLATNDLQAFELRHVLDPSGDDFAIGKGDTV